jgi:hypothetical protein
MGRLGCSDHGKPYIAPIIIFRIRVTDITGVYENL